MSANDHKTFLTSELNKLLEAVDKLSLHPKNKPTLYTVKVVMASDCSRVEHNVSEAEFRQSSKQLYTIIT